MNYSELKILPMNISDLDKIRNTLEQDYDNFWNYEIFKEELGNNNSSYLLLQYESEFVSYGGLKIILDEAELMNIVTKKDKRHMGFAKLLLKSLISFAQEKQCTKINLEVNENNKNAIKLYESFGFKTVGLRKKYYNNVDNAILMTLDLNGF